MGLGLALLGLSAWCAITRLGLPVLHEVRNSGFALFFGALTLLSLGPPSRLAPRLFQAGWLRFFGKYSYGLYVYHAILSWFFREQGVDGRLDALLGSHGLAIAARALLGFGISIAVAVLSYELFEKRFLGLKRYFRGSSSYTGGAPAAPSSRSESALTLTAEPASLIRGRAPPR